MPKTATITLDSIRRSPNSLAEDYQRFDVAHRLLLTGHSHQAWPDAAEAGQLQAFDDAAQFADHKWDRALAKAEGFRNHVRRILRDPDGQYALGSNTHELLLRALSAMPFEERPRILTTSAEYHSARRQFDRMSELAWIEIEKVDADPVDSLAARLSEGVDDRTAVVYVSHVLFQSGRIVSGLEGLAEVCAKHGSALMVDMYHSINVLDVSIESLGLESAFILGGGYKYMQCGEGNCFMRLPDGCKARPVITGWFAEFDAIKERASDRVAYGRGQSRFAGATYDPTSHYRAVASLDFQESRGLTPSVLRQISQHQVGLLARTFDELDLPVEIITRDRTVALEAVGGFLALESARAAELCTALDELGVQTDSRGSILRFGPAPYLSDAQLITAMQTLPEAIERLKR